jgi:hypothetical protein
VDVLSARPQSVAPLNSEAFMFFSSLRRLYAEYREMPTVRINLMHEQTAGNDPFYSDLVRRFYADARRRRLRRLLFRQMTTGVALCQLPDTFAKYFLRIEGSARRNYKKALKEGCTVRRIEYNDHLDDVRDIWQSTHVRQGKSVPREFIEGAVRPCSDPPSRSPLHGYPYFGAFVDNKMVGYVGCMVAGEVCLVEQILGHAGYLTVGAVPQLIIGVAEYLYAHHPQVKYYAYGTYFGAKEGLRRFKRKFDFCPHRVDWVLGDAGSPPGIKEGQGGGP